MTPPPPTVLISKERVRTRIAELARQIEDDYRDSQDLVCIGVLKGGVFFMVDLLKQVSLPLSVDFFQASSYRGNHEAGEVRISKDIETFIRGKDVLLIEDIIDTGYTLRTILDLFKFRGARSVKLCVLLDKTERRLVEVPVDYCGFEIEDLFVVGYGLDDQEKWRNLDYIGVSTLTHAREQDGETR